MLSNCLGASRNRSTSYFRLWDRNLFQVWHSSYYSNLVSLYAVIIKDGTIMEINARWPELLSLQPSSYYPFLFSVIIPIYNTEEYLEEAIESVINQTLSFEKNIQLILVNNATTDNCGIICEKYRDQYPKNVIYIVLDKNVGPSGARNRGVKFATGKYVHFLDSDDKWSPDAFAIAYAYFETCYKDVDVVSCRTWTFDSWKKWYVYDYKYKKTRIVDVLEDYHVPQLAASSLFIKLEVATQHSFDEQLFHAEDMKYINTIILEKCKYALLREAVYCYRKRQGGGESLAAISDSRESWYFETIHLCYNYLIELSLKKFGEVIPYIQYIVMHELQWRFEKPLAAFITGKKRDEYLQSIKSLLQHIDDNIICEQQMWRERKVIALSMKHGKDIRNELCLDKNAFRLEGVAVFHVDRHILHLTGIDIEGDEIVIRGRVNLPLAPSTFTIYAKDDKGKIYELSLKSIDDNFIRYSFDIPIFEVLSFTLKLPLSESLNFSFFLQYRRETRILHLSYEFIVKIANDITHSYFVKNGYIVTKKGNTSISLEKYTLLKKIQYEYKLLSEMYKKNNISKKCIVWRLIIQFSRMLSFNSSKQTWLVLDQFSKAGDNGEYFFKYLMEKKPKNVVARFVLSENSVDYGRMKSIGPMLKYNSPRYRLQFALASKIISSQSFYNASNTFCQYTPYLQDLFHFKFVYLQHGVIKDNHASTQSRAKLHLDMFVTTAKDEYNSIVHNIGGYYDYDETIVKLTGMPRYDSIKLFAANERPKRILLAPTWRKKIAGRWNESIQTCEYSKTYKNSIFYAFYNRLINDERLLNTMKQYGYTGALRLHERMRFQAQDFVSNAYFSVEETREPYDEEIAQTGLLVTDYSSIAFDYVYAGIPVIYAQFDKDEFYQEHGYTRGYFDYETGGFGPLCYNYENLVDSLIELIENGCTLQLKYKKRRNDFFEFFDSDNSLRVFNAVMSMPE